MPSRTKLKRGRSSVHVPCLRRIAPTNKDVLQNGTTPPVLQDRGKALNLVRPKTHKTPVSEYDFKKMTSITTFFVFFLFGSVKDICKQKIASSEEKKCH